MACQALLPGMNTDTIFLLFYISLALAALTLTANKRLADGITHSITVSRSISGSSRSTLLYVDNVLLNRSISTTEATDALLWRQTYFGCNIQASGGLYQCQPGTTPDATVESINFQSSLTPFSRRAIQSISKNFHYSMFLATSGIPFL